MKKKKSVDREIVILQLSFQWFHKRLREVLSHFLFFYFELWTHRVTVGTFCYILADSFTNRGGDTSARNPFQIKNFLSIRYNIPLGILIVFIAKTPLNGITKNTLGLISRNVCSLYWFLQAIVLKLFVIFMHGLKADIIEPQIVFFCWVRNSLRYAPKFAPRPG